MLLPRIIPCLLVSELALVKTTRFKKPIYVGDPVNVIRIFNEKEVDEIAVLDISATPTGNDPPYKLLEELASECFMPLSYGGGVRTIEQMKRIYSLGIEKISLNSNASQELISAAADKFGSQSVVVSVDVKKKLFGGYEVFTRCGKRGTGIDPVCYCTKMAEYGAGEIFLTSIDREGTQSGYDIELIKQVTESVSIPVIANGGAKIVEDFGKAIHDGGAAACAAGSSVVFYGKHRAVLISFPKPDELLAEITKTKVTPSAWPSTI